ncbi:MAG: hypothetical protein HUJ26_15865 [Planctomycetaceae bacterium]|nr:hypothetical protein [Planctomycetaceae bacterium]
MAILTLLCSPIDLMAGKGNGGGGGGKPPKDDPQEPVAVGTIYLTQGDAVYAMNSDGSDLTLVIPADIAKQYYQSASGTVVPSHHVDGPDLFFDRWWLGVKSLGTDPLTGIEIKELFAFRMERGESGPVVDAENQLTNAFVDRFLVNDTDRKPSWGPNDAFVSFTTTEFGVEDDTPYVIAKHLTRLDVSGADLMFAMFAESEDYLLRANSEQWSLPVTLNSGYYEKFRQHRWGPLGETVAYLGVDTSVEGTKPDLFLTNTNSGATTKLWESTYYYTEFDWAKDGSLFAIDTGFEIHVRDLNGNSNFVLIDGSWEGFLQPHWSPDSSQLLVKKVARKGGGFDPVYNYYLERISRNGGDLISVPTGLDESISFEINAWVSNDLPE